MAIQPKKGESPTKQLNVGRSSTSIANGILAPKPTTAMKAAPVTPKPAPKPAKSNFKAPSYRQTGMKMAMKKGPKRGGSKCFSY
jgi:hypothetical protein